MQNQEDNWLPLESNPQVMNKFISGLGLNTSVYNVQDLLSTEQWAQEMLGKPVLGIVFLYQINEKQKLHEKAQAEKLQNNKVSPNIFYMKQYAKNACGTIALFHIIMNKIYDYDNLVKPDSYLSKFREETFGKKPEEIGQMFKKNKQICTKHKQSVKEGQTQVQSKVETHFIAFIEKDGHIYELDGRKKQPINHGQCIPEGLPMLACLVIKQFMDRDPENNKFTILALAKNPDL